MEMLKAIARNRTIDATEEKTPGKNIHKQCFFSG
jgi:hypothetical protein